MARPPASSSPDPDPLAALADAIVPDILNLNDPARHAKRRRAVRVHEWFCAEPSRGGKPTARCLLGMPVNSLPPA
ncbi:hypothetical protein NITHO_50009 [Nitrolancea hollandica Lb]|uniref:Uncharacterized protein n=1 Tax=Nitrolancea hollandica Lb TaxID=1129897 RepID=I4EL98_9BACT|nr:hypothetical protein NITHO_50009 [Nitrolancea hollandica Lb]